MLLFLEMTVLFCWMTGLLSFCINFEGLLGSVGLGAFPILVYLLFCGVYPFMYSM